MAKKRITDLGVLTAAEGQDKILVVDVSDTTHGADGRSKVMDVGKLPISEAQALAFSAKADDAALQFLDSRVVGVESNKQEKSEKGQSNGYAGLDINAKVPTSQLPDSVLGALEYKQPWNANTNTPTIPAASSANRGWYYKVSVAGTTNIDGITDWGLGDWIISNGTTWDKLDNSDSVSSVQGKTGAVSLNATEIPVTGGSGTTVYTELTNRIVKNEGIELEAGKAAITATIDWNSYKNSGFYKGSNMLHASGNSINDHTWRYVIVVQHGAGNSSQLSWDYTGNHFAYRSSLNNYWSPWRYLMDERDKLALENLISGKAATSHGHSGWDVTIEDDQGGPIDLQAALMNIYFRLEQLESYH